MFEPLESAQFRWLFASNSAFFLAMQAQVVLRSWIAFELTGSELALGSVSFAVAIPMLIVAPFGGAIGDRIDRRRVVILGQASVAIGEVILLTLLLTDLLRFWHLVALAFVMGCAFPFIMPARQALVANIVGRARLTSAMALNMAGMNTCRVLGPALAGLLIAWIGVKGAYPVTVTLYFVALLCMVPVHKAVPDAAARSLSLGQNVIEGVRYVASERLVLVLLFFGLLPMFLAMPFQTLLVVFAREVWNVGGTGLGLLSASVGAGGVIGAVMVAMRPGSSRRLGSMLRSMTGFGAFLVLFAISPWFATAVPLVLIANIFASIFSTLNNTAIQVLIPDAMRGRVSSFLMMSFSLPLLGTLPLSALAEIYGVQTAVAGASVLAVAIGIAFYAFSPALRGLDSSIQRAMLRE